MTSISVHVDSSTAKDEHGLEVVTQPDGGWDDGWTDEARSELTTALSKEDRKEKIVDDLFAEMDPTKKSPRKKGKGKGKGKGKRKSDVSCCTCFLAWPGLPWCWLLVAGDMGCGVWGEGSCFLCRIAHQSRAGNG